MLARRVALASILIAAAPAQAETSAPPAPSRYLEVHVYDPEGPFVTVPAKTFGMLTLIVVGGTAALFCTPIDLGRGVARQGGFGELAEQCGSQVGQAAASVTYVAFGAPFWLLKRGLWDGPRRLLGITPEPEKVQPDIG